MTSARTDSPAGPGRGLASPWPWAVLLAALAVRILAVAQAAIINPDGPLYIHQARAIFHGQWDRISDCASGVIILPLSSFPFLIAGVYPFTGDWLLAARVVGVACGALASLPVWLIARRFASPAAAGLTCLAYAMMPTLVEMSAEAVRGPVFFLFLAFGLLLLIRAVEETGRSRTLWLVAASVVLALSAWGRVEALVYLAGGGLFLVLFSPGVRRLTDPLALALPALILAAIGVGLLMNLQPPSAGGASLSLAGLAGAALKPVLAYLDLTSALDAARLNPPPGVPGEYLVMARDYIWLMALAGTVHLFLEGLWYPFAIIAFVGLAGLVPRLRADRRQALVALLAVLSLVGVYLGLVTTWWPIRRYWAVCLLPWIPFLAHGLSLVMDRLTWQRAWNPVLAVALLAGLIITLTAPRNLAPREEDKAVFADIGRSIAASREAAEPAGVVSAGESAALWWTIFYANLDYTGPVCPRPNPDQLVHRQGREPWDCVAGFKARGADYYLWLERQPPPEWFGVVINSPGCLTEIGRWEDTPYGLVRLFRINDRPPGSGPWRRPKDADKAPAVPADASLLGRPSLERES